MSGTDVPAADDADAGGAIVTAAGPGMRAVLHDLALPTFARYADAWQWKLEAHDLQADGLGADAGAVAAKWAKLDLLHDALLRHPYALWIDADVLLLREDDDIREHLHPGDFQALVLEHVPTEHRLNPNTGVWLMRSCPAAFAFLDAVRTRGLQPGPWADQGAVMAALGWERGDANYHWARPGAGNAFSMATSWLPPGWNQPFLGPRPEADVYGGNGGSYADRPTVRSPHALHFMGMLPPARYRQMERILAGGTIDDADRGTVG